jgi:hypothetical protein
LPQTIAWNIEDHFPGDIQGQATNGESLAYVKDQMGHHSIQITVDTYGHLIPGANRQAVNRLAEMVENPQPIRNQAQKRGYPLPDNPLKRLVGHEGFEPSTS